MYRKITRSKLFVKDSTKTKLSDQHYSKFIIYVGKLLSHEQLPPEADLATLHIASDKDS